MAMWSILEAIAATQLSAKDTVVKELQETWVRSLGGEDPLAEGMATHSSILAWRIPMDRGAWRATIHRVTKRRT